MNLEDPTAQNNQPDGDSGDEQPEEQAGDFFSPEVRYSDPQVTCGNCEYFNAGQCSNDDVIQDMGGQVDAGGRCERFDPKGDGADELSQSIQGTKPFGAAMTGMSNS